MSNPSAWLRAWIAGACGAWLLFPAGAAVADPIPDNRELYRMILELQASQQKLVDEAAKAKAEAARAQEQLDETRKELEDAQEKLAASEATPPVSAPAPEEGAVYVKQANLPEAFGAYAELHMLRATDNNQDFASLSTEPAGSTEIGTTTNKIVQSNYELSYKLGATYHPGGSWDFAFAYQSFDNNDGDAKLIPPFESPDGNQYVSLIATLAPPSFGQVAESARADDEFKLQGYDWEAGKNLEVGEDFALRLFGGVRYVDMSEHFEAFYFDGDFATEAEGGGRSNSDFGFWGIGPRVGAGGRYPVGWGFSIFGQAGVSLLVGEQEAESGFTNPADDSDTDPLYFVHRDFGVQVIPAIDMRAGLAWEHPLWEWGKGFIEGGYEFQNYFNVVEQLTWGPPSDPGAVGQTSGDLGIDGFFFRGGLRFFGP